VNPDDADHFLQGPADSSLTAGFQKLKWIKKHFETVRSVKRQSE
jgi:hypothetical protein